MGKNVVKVETERKHGRIKQKGKSDGKRGKNIENIFHTRVSYKKLIKLILQSTRSSKFD
jgi:hypothetical protein